MSYQVPKLHELTIFDGMFIISLIVTVCEYASVFRKFSWETLAIGTSFAAITLCTAVIHFWTHRNKNEDL